MVRRVATLAAGVCLAFCASTSQAQKFLPDDPIWVDDDRLAIEEPDEMELANVYDFLENTFNVGTPPKGTVPRATNVNTLGEIPDSSWFENRIGRRAMSIEELVRGPNTTGGPDTTKPWTIIRGKSGGITPGFTVHDDRGDVYFIKFDPSDYPSLPSGADVIGTKLFHAMGYHVPANYIAHIRRNNLTISPMATISGGGRKKATMTESDLDAILEDVVPRADGRIRVIASLNLAGRPIGPRKFWGTLGDDANDILPHEDRRELRALRLFSAWLNHDDSRSINSLDMFVAGEGERGHVKHYLIDFSSTLGSGSLGGRITPQSERAGNEYLLDWGAFWKVTFSLGLWDRKWRNVEYPDYPEIGNFEADFFQPHLWVPEYPNVAFDRMLNDDAFWAAHIIEQFSDEAIRAIVATGRYLDPEAPRYLAETLIKRRDKCVDHYYRQLNPLHGFRMEDARLIFDNLGEARGLASVDGYEVRWQSFDNDDETRVAIGSTEIETSRTLAIPDSAEDFLVVRLRTRSSHPEWNKFVDVYLRNTSPPKIVGIEREN